MYTVLSDSRENTTKKKKERKCNTEVRLLWPSSHFGTKREENRRRELTAQIPLVATTKMGFWLNLNEQVFQSQKMCLEHGSLQQGNPQSRYESCLCRKAAWSHQHLQDSIALSLFKVYGKKKCRRPQGGRSGVQGSHTVLWSWTVLHGQRVMPFCMLWLIQLSRSTWGISKDKFCITPTRFNTYSCIPCNTNKLVSFFLHRYELLNARAWACECQSMTSERGAKEEKVP